MVACTRAKEDTDVALGDWVASGMVGLSHYVAGLRLGCRMPAVGGAVKQHCLRHGYAPVMTMANGDCGIEAMLIVAGAKRGPQEAQRLRRTLADFMTTKAGAVEWQQAFKALQEHDEAEQDEAAALVASSPAAAPSGAAPQQAPPPLPPPADEAEPHAQPSGAGAPAPPPNCDAPPLPPPAAEPTPSSADRLRAAVAWVSGSGKFPRLSQDRIARLLSPEQAAAVVARHEASMRDPAKSSVVARAQGLRLLGKTGGVPRLVDKLKDAARVADWLKAKGLSQRRYREALPRGTWRLFWKEHAEVPLTRAEQNRSRAYIHRCLKLREKHPGLQGTSVLMPGGRRKVRHWFRRRAESTQGRPTKASLVREQLFQWFCSIRRSVKTRLPARVVLTQASIILEQYVLHAVAQTTVADAPVLSKGWLRDWRLEYGISLRKPNRRSQVPRCVMQERLRTMWCNVIRVRRLAQHLLGYDPPVDNMDQSPFHMNEAGSQSCGTLSLRGCGVVPLNELHSATRSRWTANTLVRSDFAPEQAPPPLELMFKNATYGPTRSRLQEHIPAWAPWLSVVTSPSGTYAEVELLEYMERLYPLPVHPRTRWRILLLDAFAPHMTERVRRVAWARRVVICLHGGGTTSVGQVNDTDLHHPLRTEYTALETEDALRQATLGTPCPIIRKEDCIAWMCLVWCRTRLHAQAAAGFKKVGVTNALDGSEDGRVSREARTFWDSARMKTERASAVADVDEEVAAGRLRWTYGDVYRIICEHPKRGHVDVQPDDEGSGVDSQDGDGVWLEEDDEDDDGPPPPQGAPPHLPADAVASASAEPRAPPQEVLRDVELAQDRLEMLRTVLLQLEQAGADALANSVRATIHQESKRMRNVSSVPDDLRLALADAEEEASRDALRRKALLARDLAADAKARQTLRELQREQRVLQQRREALAKASSVEESLRALKRWSVADFGQGHPQGGSRAHAANRREVVERLRRRAPALPPDLANDWDYFMRSWDARRVMALNHFQKPAWGSRFLNMMVELHEEMRRDPQGDAFARWMRREMTERHFPRADLRV